MGGSSSKKRGQTPPQVANRFLSASIRLVHKVLRRNLNFIEKQLLAVRDDLERRREELPDLLRFTLVVHDFIQAHHAAEDEVFNAEFRGKLGISSDQFDNEQKRFAKRLQDLKARLDQLLAPGAELTGDALKEFSGLVLSLQVSLHTHFNRQEELASTEKLETVPAANQKQLVASYHKRLGVLLKPHRPVIEGIARRSLTDEEQPVFDLLPGFWSKPLKPAAVEQAIQPYHAYLFNPPPGVKRSKIHVDEIHEEHIEEKDKAERKEKKAAEEAAKQKAQAQQQENGKEEIVTAAPADDETPVKRNVDADALDAKLVGLGPISREPPVPAEPESVQAADAPKLDSAAKDKDKKDKKEKAEKGNKKDGAVRFQSSSEIIGEPAKSPSIKSAAPALEPSMQASGSAAKASEPALKASESAKASESPALAKSESLKTPSPALVKSGSQPGAGSESLKASASATASPTVTRVESVKALDSSSSPSSTVVRSASAAAASPRLETARSQTGQPAALSASASTSAAVAATADHVTADTAAAESDLGSAEEREAARSFRGDKIREVEAELQAAREADAKAAEAAAAAEKERLERERVELEAAERILEEERVKEEARLARVAEAERIIREQEEFIKAEIRRKEAENAKPAALAPTHLIIPKEEGRRLKKRDGSTSYTPAETTPATSPTLVASSSSSKKAATAAAVAKDSPTVGRKEVKPDASPFMKKQLAPKPAPAPAAEPAAPVTPAKPTPKRWTIGASTAGPAAPPGQHQLRHTNGPTANGTKDQSYFSGPVYLGPISSLVGAGPKPAVASPAKPATVSTPVVASKGMSVKEKAEAFKLAAERQRQADESWKRHRDTRGKSQQGMSPSGSEESGGGGAGSPKQDLKRQSSSGNNGDLQASGSSRGRDRAATSPPSPNAI